MTMHADVAFAPVDADLHLERVAGGNETEVYRTDDGRFVVKVKSEETDGALEDMLAKSHLLRSAANAFGRAVGSEHSIPNMFLISGNGNGLAQLLVLQPYLRQARPLSDVDFRQLEPAERRHVASQLRRLIWRARRFYRQTGHMPDLYGRTSRSQHERKLLNTPARLPWRLWSFLVKRTLLHSHNLMLTDAPDYRVILVDYDPVQRSWLYRWVYYTVRRLLFWRDYGLIWLMERTGYVPGS